ncbi:hypothetical protein KZ810_16510 [Sphingomonas sp. RHCKR47]|uniref:hypothetical protein n=1 Tax=Sphingomonas citricola TaxID=2862498 RepID=UPI001CA5C963|nr:hypothetical protein [Sphingomonas citricola]MBW6525100.1 hypothetical protein [Sphingomonas citricola]
MLIQRWRQGSRRLFPLYEHYRTQLRKADVMARDERIRYRDVHLKRLRSLAELAGIDFDATTTKTDVREKPERYHRRSWWPSTSAATGGTTGAPLVVHRTLASVVYEQATIDHVVALHGVDLRNARQAVFRADSFKAPDDRTAPFWYDASDRKRLFSSMHLNAASAPAILAALADFRPDILYCYPSALELLIAHVRDRQVEIRPHLVLTSSEYMPAALFDAVRTTFDCPLLDYYGQAERVCFASADAAGAYHFRHDYGMVELDRGGTQGIVVGTNFHNTAQLLPHYDTGDVIVGVEQEAGGLLEDVALGLAPFKGIAGRAGERMVLPDGRQIIGFNHMPRLVPGADFVQFLRTGPHALDVHVVRGASFSDATLAAIERNVRLKVPTEVTTRYIFGDAPLRTPRGKSPIYIDTTSQ